jgi:hypothetical protein
MTAERGCTKTTNLKDCPCTYPCSRKGACCECIRSHWFSRRELPACFFTPEAERTFDRSLDHFLALWSGKDGKRKNLP